MPPKKKSKALRRRIPWVVRIGVWSTLLVIAIVGLVFFLLRGDGEDGGGTSTFRPVHEFDTGDYHSLAFSPTQDGVVLFGHHNGLQMSEDGGQTWQEVVYQPNWDAMNLVYDPFSPDRVYMAGHNVYYRSDDRGKTWEEVNSDLPGLDLHAFAASPSRQGRLYAFALGYGLYVSEDGGEKWRGLWSEAPQGTVSILEVPDGTLLLAAADAGILRSEDGGGTWTESRQGIETGVIFTIKGDPQGQRLYAGTSDGLYVSLDAGRSWTPTSLVDTTAVVVGVNPAEPLGILVVNLEGKLYRSGDGGQTW